jgi:hypothetical protein
MEIMSTRYHFILIIFDGFDDGFNDVKSNNREILETNPRLWYNVISLEINSAKNCNVNFLKELKIKMPKLVFVKFDMKPTEDERKRMHVTSNRFTMIGYTRKSVEDDKKWLIYSALNFKHLVLSSFKLPSKESELAQKLNKRIQQLDIDEKSDLGQLTNISYIYFSNVQYINFCLNNSQGKSEWYANIVMKILKNFKNLKTFIMYVPSLSIFAGKQLSKIVEFLNMNEILENYQKVHYPQYFLFSRKRL